MRQRLLYTTDAVQIENVLMGGAMWDVNVVNDEKDEIGKGKLEVQIARREAKFSMVFVGGRVRFERRVGGEPVQFLQRDLSNGVLTWNAARPYTGSGREFVEVPLGIDLVLS